MDRISLFILSLVYCLLAPLCTPLGTPLGTQSYAQGRVEKRLQAWQDLLERFEISPTQPTPAIIDETQRLWLRKKGQERWDLPLLERSDRLEIIQDLTELGYITARKARRKHYDYCLVLGATLPSMQNRLQYLEKLWNEGVRFDEIICLTSERPLSAKGDGPLYSEYQTEGQALRALIDKILPTEIKAVALRLICARVEGRRPNTADTVEAWLSAQPKPGSILALSSQPHINYQDAVLCALLPGFCVETVGDQAKEDLNLAVALDACTRHLYARHAQHTLKKEVPAGIFEPTRLCSRP